MRSLLAVVLVGLLIPSGADAKLRPAFAASVAKQGDVIELDLGEGSGHYLGPLRIYLVPLSAADDLHGERDPRLIPIGELGTPGEFGTPSTLRFEVPNVPAGEYTAAIWFKGYATQTWANALEGIHPLLTIQPRVAAAATPASSEGRPPLWAVAVGACACLVCLTGWRRRRAGAAPR